MVTSGGTSKACKSQWAHQAARSRNTWRWFVLIVGGLGGLGLGWRNGQRKREPGHLVLLSRTGIGSNAGPFAEERQRRSARSKRWEYRFTVVAGDVASTADMKPSLRSIRTGISAVARSLSCCHGCQWGETFDLTEESIDTMFRSKVLGHGAARANEESESRFFLDLFLCGFVAWSQRVGTLRCREPISGLVATLAGAPGTGRAVHQLGTWDTDATGAIRDQSPFSKAGFLPMPPKRFSTCSESLIVSSRAQVMIANVDWNVLKPALESQRTRPLLEKLGQHSRTQTQIRVATVAKCRQSSSGDESNSGKSQAID